jgi:LEA14-like dessication related protein
MRLFNVIAGLFLVTLLAGCAGLTPSYEKPQVNITSVSLAPQSEFATPTFMIGLQVINPNRHDLPLHGMTYSLEVDDHRILSGAEPDLPRIPGYGTSEFTITASPDLLGSARLINQILSGQNSTMTYRFKARLDVGSLLPFITIEETGEFGLGAATTESEI